MQRRPKTQTIFLIDDSDLERESLAAQLTEEGYTVLETGTGRGASEFIEHNDIDLVLLDIMLPDIDGLTVLRAIRRLHTAAGLPVIMLTARGENSDIVEGLSLGANDYLTKPIDIDVLLARVQTQVSLKRAKEALRESEERYALAVLGANDGIWDWDLRSGDIYLSPRWKALLGYAEYDIENSTAAWFDRVHPEDLGRIQESIRLHVEGLVDHLEMEYRMSTASGRFQWVLTRGIAIRDHEGKAYRMAGSQTDITGSKLTDALSGLPNKMLFMDRVAHAVKRLNRATDPGFVVCSLDIDRFNLVNESLGHFAGDLLLKQFSNRLAQCLRPEDTLARMGGDEFGVLLEGLHSNDDVLRFAERIRAKIAAPFIINDREIFVTFGIGIVYGHRGYHSSEELVRDADTALHRAKARGTSNLEVFDPAMHVRVVKRFQVEGDLRKALDKSEMFLCYQPIVSSGDETRKGFEALVRWRNPRQTLPVPPLEFIPIAEETGLIVPLGGWVFRTACETIRNYNRKTRQKYSIAINFSGRQFQQKNVVETVSDVLAETGFDPELIKIELTESVLLENAEEAVIKLHRFRDMGMGIAIDDFGTGYSSLAYLNRFPITALKIDQSFVRDAEVDSGAANIIRAIVTLAHNLRLEVIAEGVETEAQRTFLREYGCDSMQGFLFGRPLTIEQLELERNSSKLKKVRDIG